MGIFRLVPAFHRQTRVAFRRLPNGHREQPRPGALGRGERIEEARTRLSDGPPVPTRDYRGAARKQAKSVEELRESGGGLNVEARAFKFEE